MEAVIRVALTICGVKLILRLKNALFCYYISFLDDRSNRSTNQASFPFDSFHPDRNEAHHHAPPTHN